MAQPTQIITNAVAGPFQVKYSGPAEANPSVATLGVIGEKGVKQIRRYTGESIKGDLTGDTTIDDVYMGGDMFLEFELEEANLNTVMCLENPFRKTFTSGVDGDNEVGIPGTFASSYAGSLILHPLYSVSGTIHTSAGAQTTPVRTYGLVVLATGFEKEKLFASRRRKIPVRMRCYPYVNGATTSARYVWYTVAALGGSYLTS